MATRAEASMPDRFDAPESRTDITHSMSDTSVADGTTVISDQVVAAIAGHAAQDVEGVIKLGTGNIVRTLSDAMGSKTQKLRSGIGVEAGRKEAIFDLEMTVESGYPIPEIANNVRQVISQTVKEQTGLTVKAINITVSDIQFPDRQVGRVV